MIGHEEEMKLSAEKPNWNLIPMTALAEVVKVLDYGSQKYNDHQWTQGNAERYLRSMFRHLVAYIGGEVEDEESGLHHIAHAATNALFILSKERGGMPDQIEHLSALRELT